jgi:LacI family transcriptional regulator
MMNKRVRVVDVAKAAGCSSATVSRALNSPEKVGPAILARVREAVERLGFTPDTAARALRSRRTNMCGAVIPTLDHAIYARQVNALQERLLALGYSLIVTTSHYDGIREFEQARMLVERGAEGLVLVGDAHDPRLYDFLDLRNVPFVNTYVFNPTSGHPCVGFDNEKAAREVTEFLLLLGHRRFGIVAGLSEGNDRVGQRLAGTLEALSRHGISLPLNRIVEEPYAIDAGYEGMRTLLSSGETPTAVFCFSDILAIGAVACAQDKGLTVPGDISVVGFDNLDYAGYVRPALTTVEVPAAEMGRLAAEYLAARLRGERRRDYWELETRLIVRRTTRPPPGVDARSASLSRAAISLTPREAGGSEIDYNNNEVVSSSLRGDEP